MTVLTKKEPQRKIISISEKRQITIPKTFFERLPFTSEAICSFEDGVIVIRPLERGGEEFSEPILAELLREGYSGDELLEEFIKRRNAIRPAVEKMIVEAQQAAQAAVSFDTIDEL